MNIQRIPIETELSAEDAMTILSAAGHAQPMACYHHTYWESQKAKQVVILKTASNQAHGETIREAMNKLLHH